jgi:NADH-quinone oxidoreductase subunit C
MKTPQEIFELLKAKFGDAVIAQKDNALFDYEIEINPANILEVCEFLYYDKELVFDSLTLLSAVDDANGTKTTNPDGSFDITGGTLSLFYHLESTSLKHRALLKVSLPREKAEIETVCYIWNHANWEEREAYDMMGITFLNHPDLRRILMPDDWEGGHPLRKDYKNPEFYHGMKIPY